MQQQSNTSADHVVSWILRDSSIQELLTSNDIIKKAISSVSLLSVDSLQQE